LLYEIASWQRPTRERPTSVLPIDIKEENMLFPMAESMLGEGE
jgi:hypothetical protein